MRRSHFPFFCLLETACCFATCLLFFQTRFWLRVLPSSILLLLPSFALVFSSRLLLFIIFFLSSFIRGFTCVSAVLPSYLSVLSHVLIFLTFYSTDASATSCLPSLLPFCFLVLFSNPSSQLHVLIRFAFLPSCFFSVFLTIIYLIRLSIFLSIFLKYLACLIMWQCLAAKTTLDFISFHGCKCSVCYSLWIFF